MKFYARHRLVFSSGLLVDCPFAMHVLGHQLIFDDEDFVLYYRARREEQKR